MSYVNKRNNLRVGVKVVNLDEIKFFSSKNGIGVHCTKLDEVEYMVALLNFVYENTLNFEEIFKYMKLVNGNGIVFYGDGTVSSKDYADIVGYEVYDFQ